MKIAITMLLRNPRGMLCLWPWKVDMKSNSWWTPSIFSWHVFMSRTKGFYTLGPDLSLSPSFITWSKASSSLIFQITDSHSHQLVLHVNINLTVALFLPDYTGTQGRTIRMAWMSWNFPQPCLVTPPLDLSIQDTHFPRMHLCLIQETKEEEMPWWLHGS